MRLKCKCLSKIGYEAQNETNNITLPGVPPPILLNTINSWIVIQQRVDGTLNFAQNWNTYKSGFGSISANFWLGNENIHLLTNAASYWLRIELMAGDNRWYSAEYADFRIKNEGNKYQLELSGYTGDYQDPMSYPSSYSDSQYGMNFSTIDVDNDSSGAVNCSGITGGGWWFSSCGVSCLNCKYGQWFAWAGFPSPTFYLKTARMMIKAY